MGLPELAQGAANIQGPGDRRTRGRAPDKADTVVLPGTGLRSGRCEAGWEQASGKVKVSEPFLETLGNDTEYCISSVG